MSQKPQSFGADCRGGSAAGFLFASVVAIFMSVFAVQIAGSFLTAQLVDATRAMTAGGFARLVSRGGEAAPCNGQGGLGCPVRVMAAPVGYPGLGVLRSGGGPAFLVAASPSGQ